MKTPPPEAPLHSRLPPSKAAVWSVCTASVGYIERNASLLPKESSVYADEGTTAHALAAKILNGENRLVQSDNPDMLHNVRAYVDFVRSLVRPGDRLSVEVRVSLFYLESQRGTIDVRIVGKDRIAIVDLKYGAGVGVYAEKNEQLAIYAESVVRELELVQDYAGTFPIELHVFQPRDRNDSEAVRSWPLTREQLSEFVTPIGAKARFIVANPDAGEFVAGPHCDKGFCAARGICKAYASRGLTVIADDLPVDEAIAEIPETHIRKWRAPESLTRDQRLTIIAHRSILEKWLEAVEEQEITELKNGAEPLTFKLVEGKSNRVWSSEDGAMKLLSTKKPLDEVAPRSVVSPAQAEKLFKGDKAFVEAFSTLITKPTGRPSLVPIADKRPALVYNPTSGLEDVDVV